MPEATGEENGLAKCDWCEDAAAHCWRSQQDYLRFSCDNEEHRNRTRTQLTVDLPEGAPVEYLIDLDGFIILHATRRTVRPALGGS